MPQPVEEYTDERLDLLSPWDPLSRSGSSARTSDELYFGDSVSEGSHFRSGAEVVTQQGLSSNMNPKYESSLAGPIQETSGYQKFLTAEDKTSLQKLLVMDLELATAMRLSVLENQAKAASEKREDEAIMTHLKRWDEEIERLKGWSKAFDNSLGAKPSEAETKKQFSIFEQLAKIGSAFSTFTKFLTSPSFRRLSALNGRVSRLISTLLLLRVLSIL
jgi:hypothetical protein